MFDWLKKKKKPAAAAVPYQMRDTLFGDMPWSVWAQGSQAATGEPWSSFAAAHARLDAGDRVAAADTLRGVLAQPDLESRQYLQAWHFLRELGIEPAAAEAKHVYGVVVEVGINGGLDIVAAYEDHTARYYNFSGAAIIWESPAATLNAPIDALIAAGRTVAAQIGPWTEPRPDAPPEGQARITMLTPSGPHFGQADMDALARDPLAAPVLQRAQMLMQALIKL